MPAVKKIIIDDAIPFAQEMFDHLGVIKLIPGKEINAENVKDADALIIRSRTNINQALLNKSQVSFVGSTVVGLDHVDQEYLQVRKVHFYSAQGCNANSVAEYIITCLLIMAEKHDFELSQKTLGIIGVGHVGSLVLKKAQALGIKCLLNDPPKVLSKPEINKDYTNIETCLEADIITVHTPLTRDGDFPTLDLLNPNRLKNIQPHQTLINAARGGIINETAWSQTPTLCNIIDCWVNEPDINEALYNQADIATPHIAGHSLDAKIAGTEMVYQQLCKFWNVSTQDSWKKSLPSLPEAIEIETTTNRQQDLKEIIQKTHNPLTDDQAIRSIKIEDLRKKYEDYRRNFPIYREWKQHNLTNLHNKELHRLLINIGFNDY